MSAILTALPVVRTGVTNVAVTVSFSTGLGTAIDGLDYLSTNGTLSFAANVLTQSFTITLFDNTVSNVARTVPLTLATVTGPFGTQLGAQSSALLTITNDDAAAISGSVDASFASSVDSTIYAVGINTNTATPALIGKLVIAGDFTFVNGLPRTRIARLNRDGSTDTTFNAGAGANASVRALAVQSDGKVVIGGFFTTVASTARPYLARLNANGSLDAAFNAGLNGQINAILLQPDGKILIGGQFTSAGGNLRNNVARLNADGTLDNTFDPGAGASAAVRTLTSSAPAGGARVTGPLTRITRAPRANAAWAKA